MKTKTCFNINLRKKDINNLSSFLIKLGVTLGLVIAVFFLWGLTSKVEAATAEFKVNSWSVGADNDQEQSTIAVDDNNKFYIAWSHEGPTFFDIVGRVYNSSGSPITDDTEQLDFNDAENCYYPSIIVNNNNSNNNVLLTWQDGQRDLIYGGNNIFARLFKNGVSQDEENLGTAQSGPGGNTSDFRINNDITSSYECDTPWVTTTGDGSDFVATYYNKQTESKKDDNDGTSIKLAYLTSTAFPKDKKTSLGSDMLSNDADQVKVVHNESGKLEWGKAVLWREGDDKLHTQFYDKDGNKKDPASGKTTIEMDDSVITYDTAVNNQGYLGVIWKGAGDNGDIAGVVFKGTNSSVFKQDLVMDQDGPNIDHTLYPPQIFTGLGEKNTFFISFSSKATVYGGSASNWINDNSSVIHASSKINKTDGKSNRVRLLSSLAYHEDDPPLESGSVFHVRELEVTDQLSVKSSLILPGHVGWGDIGVLHNHSITVLPSASNKVRFIIKWGKHEGDVNVTLEELEKIGGSWDWNEDFNGHDTSITLPPSDLNTYQVVYSGEKYYLFYQQNSGGKIKAKVFDDDIFNGESEAEDVASVNITGGNPSVTTDNNGAPAVVYDKNNKIYAKRFDPALKALGSVVQLSEGSSSTNPDVSALSNGDFLVGFQGKVDGNNFLQPQQVNLKAFSSSLNSSTFDPLETLNASIQEIGDDSSSDDLSFFSGLIGTAHAAVPSGFSVTSIDWDDITWGESGGNGSSSVVIQISTDQGSTWLTVSNGDDVTDAIRASGLDMPPNDPTLKYRIIVSSVAEGQIPRVDWIKIGYNGGEDLDYDYHLNVSPSEDNVVVNTTQTITAKVTKTETDESSDVLSFIPVAQAASGVEIGDSGEPVVGQEVKIKLRNGYGQISMSSGESQNLGSGDEDESFQSGDDSSEGTVRGEQDDLFEPGGSDLETGDIVEITGTTNDQGTVTFYYTAAAEPNLEDTIQISTTPEGTAISVTAKMTSVDPCNTVLSADPHYVVNKQAVEFTADITNHISSDLKAIKATIALNPNLIYQEDSAVITIGDAQGDLIKDDGGGEKAKGGDKKNIEVTQDEKGNFVFEYLGNGGVIPGGNEDSITLKFKTTATVIEGEEIEIEGNGGQHSYKCGLTLAYQDVDSGKQYANNPVSYQGVVASIWLQTLFGDIYAKGGFLGSLSAPAGNYNATYLIQSDGTVARFSSEKGSEYQIENYVQALLSPSHIKSVMTNQVKMLLEDKQTFDVESIDPSRDYSPAELQAHQTYYVDGNLSVTSGEFKKPVTIIVNGDLQVKGDLNYNSAPVDQIEKLPSTGFIVLGNTYIDGDVAKGVGALYTEGEIKTGVSNKQLVWEGLLIASRFGFERTYFKDDDSLEPAEKIFYDGRIFANPPTGFSKLRDLPEWREIPGYNN